MNPLLDLGAHPVIGHRGAARYAPENTLPSFALAIEQGADAIECDVHVTADGVAVILHDATLDRTTNATGAVAAIPFEQLREVDAGAHYTPDSGRTFPWRGRDARIPTLAEALSAFPNIPFLIEVKAPNAREAVWRAVVEHEAEERCVVAAFDARALAGLREARVVCGAARSDIARLLARTLLRVPAPAVSYRAIAAPERYGAVPVVTRRFVAAARQLGCPTHVWTVDEPEDARRLWGIGVAGIITNAPDVIRAARESLDGQ
ncbi:MAG TPA: glycerophosphodiester phosphodiesterase [Gemmatimonadaceae bacterium]|nr:glycerophosphodiester phosphodiesterase [Gemmatimonadaceae bacterium]